MSSFAKILGNMLRGAVFTAGVDGMCGVVGGNIMFAANERYSGTEAMRLAATGGAVMGAGLGLLKSVYFSHSAEGEDDNSCLKAWIAQGTIIVGVASLSGTLGHTMLKHLAEMTVQETAIAAAVGSATVISSALVVAVASWALSGISHAASANINPDNSVPLRDRHSRLFQMQNEREETTPPSSDNQTAPVPMLV